MNLARRWQHFVEEFAFKMKQHSNVMIRMRMDLCYLLLLLLLPSLSGKHWVHMPNDGRVFQQWHLSFWQETFGHIVRGAYSCLLVYHVSHFLWPIWQLCQTEANSFYFTFDFSEACSFQLFNVLKIVAFRCRAAFLCTSKHFSLSLSLFARQAILTLLLSCHPCSLLC